MPTITTEDVVCHLLGQSSTDMSIAIEQQAEADEEFAAQLGLLQACIHPTGGEPAVYANRTGPTLVSQPRPRRRVARWAAIVLATVFSVGMAWAGWELIREKPLLEDHFNDNWGDMEFWRTPRRIVKVEDGHVRLIDRGYLVTTKEFLQPIKLTFRWQWSDLAGDFLYRDLLSIALRTSGVPRKEHAFEITDGIVVYINVVTGKVGVCEAGEGKHAIKESKKLKLPPYVWYDITVTDDGSNIKVFVKAPHISPEESDTPVLEFSTPIQGAQHHLAFFNREALAGAHFESWLDDIVIQRLK